MLCVTRNRLRAGRQRQARVPREMIDDEPAEVFAGVEARSDRRGADVQLLQLLRRLATSSVAAAHACGVAAEFLSERDRDGVLQDAFGRFSARRRMLSALRPRLSASACAGVPPAEPCRAAAPGASPSGTRRWWTGPC